MWQQVQKMLASVWSINDDASRPVFVHGCWRTGSTYVWSKFRADPAFRCYYEPLHEALLSTKREAFEEQFSSAEFLRSIRHPQQSTHYFAEYPLQPQGGVTNFEKRLSYERYCLEEQDADPGLQRYVTYLIDEASKSRQRPLLQFNRGLLRSRWLRRQFRSIDVLLLRRPWNVWQSFQSFANGYFTAMVVCIIGQNQRHRYFESLAQCFDVPFFVGRTVEEDYRFYRAWADERGPALYSLFYYFYTLTFLHNVSGADVILDLDAVSESDVVRKNTEGQLVKSRIPLDLSDCHPQKYDAAVGSTAIQEQEMIALLQATVMPELALSPSVIRQATPLLNADLQSLLLQFSTKMARAA